MTLPYRTDDAIAAAAIWGKVADASVGLPRGRLVRGRGSRRIVRSSRYGRHPGLLGVSRNLRRRHDRFVRGARSGPPARTHAAGRQEAAARVSIWFLARALYDAGYKRALISSDWHGPPDFPLNLIS